ncbi:hypothetical protein F4777DRAFT_545343 [Nemania sp. FL0916]|nr:hypothetical protein F4777DRAFT_545343 [Nemania sp. FL0916]
MFQVYIRLPSRTSNWCTTQSPTTHSHSPSRPHPYPRRAITSLTLPYNLQSTFSHQTPLKCLTETKVVLGLAQTTLAWSLALVLIRTRTATVAGTTAAAATTTATAITTTETTTAATMAITLVGAVRMDQRKFQDLVIRHGLSLMLLSASAPTNTASLVRIALSTIIPATAIRRKLCLL